MTQRRNLEKKSESSPNLGLKGIKKSDAGEAPYFPLPKSSVSKNPDIKVKILTGLTFLLASASYLAYERHLTPAVNNTVVRGIASEQILNKRVFDIFNLIEQAEGNSKLIIDPKYSQSHRSNEIFQSNGATGEKKEVLLQLETQLGALVREKVAQDPSLKGILTRCNISGHDVHFIDDKGTILEHVPLDYGLQAQFEAARKIIKLNPNSGLRIYIYGQKLEVLLQDGTTEAVNSE